MSDLWISDSFAKINLGLHIKRRREDGYHELETGFCFIEWSDRISMRQASATQFVTEHQELAGEKDNLIVRALNLLRKETGFSEHFEITLDKKIPIGAGLGGGSSNAATTLRMLNKILVLGLSVDELAELGGRLGADIPLFIYGKTGIGTGTGTEIEELDIQPDAWIVTVHPKFSSSTVEAYRFFNPEMGSEYSVKDILLDEDLDEWPNFLQNDLETSVFPRHDLIGNIKDQMYDFGASYASMSGSGSSVFGLFRQDFVAIQAYESFHSLGFPANLTRPGFEPDFGVYKKDIEE